MTSPVIQHQGMKRTAEGMPRRTMLATKMSEEIMHAIMAQDFSAAGNVGGGAQAVFIDAVEAAVGEDRNDIAGS